VSWSFLRGRIGGQVTPLASGAFVVGAITLVVPIARGHANVGSDLRASGRLLSAQDDGPGVGLWTRFADAPHYPGKYLLRSIAVISNPNPEFGALRGAIKDRLSQRRGAHDKVGVRQQFS
jgi:hypothetical protein